MLDKKKRPDHGHDWVICMILLDGQRTFEEIKEQFQAIPRRFGFFSGFHQERKEDFDIILMEDLQKLVNRKWIDRHGETYYLTDIGRPEAEKMHTEVTTTLQRIKRLFLTPQATARVTLIVHLVLAAVKLPAGLISGSVGLMNDALDTLMDGISSLLVFFGIKYDKEKSANIILILLMFITGGMACYQVIRKIFLPFEPHIDWFTFFAVIFSGIVAYGLMLYQKYVGSKKESFSLITQSVDSRNHVIVAGSVLGGLIAAALNFVWIDIAVGMFVSFLILKGAVEILIDFIKVAGGEQIDYSKHQINMGFRRKMEQKHMVQWMLELIDKGTVTTKQDLVDYINTQMDFSDNVTLRFYALDKKKNTDELILYSLEKIEKEDLISEETPLMLTQDGTSFLQKKGIRNKSEHNAPSVFLLKVVISFIIFLPIFLLFKFFFSLLPDFTIWNIFDRTLIHFVIDLSYTDIVMLLIGYPIFWSSLSRIGMAFHFLKKARRRGERKPQYIVDDGPFENVRHPISAARILLVLGFCTSLNNGFAFILALLLLIVWLVLACIDEQKLSKKYFPEDYQVYRKDVPYFLFKGADWILALLLLGINCIGLLIQMFAIS